MELKIPKLPKQLEFKLTKEEAIKTGKFLLGLVVAFLILNFLISLVQVQFIEYFYASAALFLLNSAGMGGEIIFQEPVLILLHNYDNSIGITYLCTGLFELIILVSAIIASFGIQLRKRLIGAAGAVVVTALFNIVRIFLSIYIIILFGLQIGELSHDLLFRIFLFLVIAGYYAAWFFWATRKGDG